ncbi:MAG: hypothetical protein HUJ77_12640, partial [Clostridium sp.]|uniref:hypothetical protein n=1 Tax=Clostridium sp. TaxID=1506 RepID=UPI0025C0F590
VINNYDKKSPFSSFLSAISGREGIPLWCFYVNRGQALSSIGIGDKNNSIMEFFPANEAYKRVYTNGFRTLIKITNKENLLYEPFYVSNSENINRRIRIKNNEIILEEVNKELGLKTRIIYFTIPNENFAALARRVEVTNIGEDKIEYEIIDGVPTVIPYGTDYYGLKNMANTLASYMESTVSDNKVATYKVRSSTGDTAEVKSINNEYIYMAFDKDCNKLNLIVESDKIFGYDTTLSEPIEFLKNPVIELSKKSQKSNNKIPAAFSCTNGIIDVEEKINIYSYLVYVTANENKNDIDKRISNVGYFEKKRIESNNIIDDISKHVNTKTAYKEFDEYIKQCYVDNVLRGGYPIQIGSSKKVYYIYSRKHGDLERDYNFFSIEPNFYSQGNGNFRDVNQNRRLDCYLHPFVGKENIKTFSDLIQLDGYNPLVVKGKKFIINDENKKVISKLDKNIISAISEVISKEFTVGELFSSLVNNEKLNKGDATDIMNRIIDISSEKVEADFAEGFWIDHWTYNLDLIEEYLNVFPDKIKELLIDEKNYRFYNSEEYVLKRKERYVISNNKIRQYRFLEKKDNLENNWIYTEKGELYQTNLLTKLIMLAGIKFLTLDEYGIGIEMEAGKPGWNDAMNGLPGLLGSSFSETVELKRLLLFIKDRLCLTKEIYIPEEFYSCLMEAYKNLSSNLTDLEYWNKSSDLREQYREETKYKISGKEASILSNELEEIIIKMISKIDFGIERAKKLNDGKIPTFMYYDITKYNVNDNQSIEPLEFKINFLPLFLEGPTRYFKTNITHEESLNIYNQIKNSEIYDKKLKMYKTSESLEDVTFEIGRSRGFTAGWLEREAIFMHMEYKYLLQLLKCGLYEEYFEEIKNILPSFMNAEVYGRSVLENSSFIASSVNPDENVHGKGFVARLTGTTVEMLNMWRIIMTGEKLFSYDDKGLKFTLSPILQKEFFDSNNRIETTLLGRIELIYINRNRKNTFGTNKGILKELLITKDNGEVIKVNGNVVKGELAKEIREGSVIRIQAYIM